MLILYALALCFGTTCQVPETGDFNVIIMEDVEHVGIELTRPDGSKFHVNARFIQLIREPTATENGNATILFTNGGQQSTKETVEEIIEMIDAEKKRDK